MELHQLQAFVIVAQERNFSRAARLLHIAQPALSRKIKHLEDELNVRLINRLTNPVALTEPGHRFLLDAQRILLLCSRSAEAARRCEDRGQSSLRIGYTTFLHHHLVSRIVELYRRTHPDIAISILDMPCSQQPTALEEGIVDVGFILAHQDGAASPTLAAQIICQHQMVVAMSAHSPFAEKQVIAPQELHEMPMASISLIPLPHSASPAVMHPDGLGEAFVRLRREAPSATLSWVAAGLGAALLPEEAAVLRLEESDVVFRRIDPPVCCGSSMVWRRDEADRTVMDFVNLVRGPVHSSESLTRHVKEQKRVAERYSARQ